MNTVLVYLLLSALGNRVERHPLLAACWAARSVGNSRTLPRGVVSQDDDVAGLIRQLSSHEPEERQRAKEALIRLGPKAREALQGLSATDDPDLRTMMQECLGRIAIRDRLGLQTRKDLQDLDSLLWDEQCDRAICSVVGAEETEGVSREFWTGFITELVAHHEEALTDQARRRVLELCRLKRPVGSARALEAWLTLKSGETRAEVVRTLALIHAESSVDAFRRLIEETDVDIRAAALLGLCASKSRDRRSLCEQLISDSAAEVRAAAIMGMAEWEDESADRLFGRALDDADESVSAVAVSIIGRRQSRTLEPRIRELAAKSEDGLASMNARLALAEWGDNSHGLALARQAGLGNTGRTRLRALYLMNSRSDETTYRCLQSTAIGRSEFWGSTREVIEEICKRSSIGVRWNEGSLRLMDRSVRCWELDGSAYECLWMVLDEISEGNWRIFAVLRSGEVQMMGLKDAIANLIDKPEPNPSKKNDGPVLHGPNDDCPRDGKDAHLGFP